MNPLAVSKDQLRDSYCQLSSKWASTKEVWNDAARNDFEGNYWLEYELVAASSMEKLQELINVLAQAEREMP